MLTPAATTPSFTLLPRIRSATSFVFKGKDVPIVLG
jgi:hypothetical protein